MRSGYQRRREDYLSLTAPYEEEIDQPDLTNGYNRFPLPFPIFLVTAIHQQESTHNQLWIARHQ